MPSNLNYHAPTYWDAPPRVELWVQDPAISGFRLDVTPLDSLTPLENPTTTTAFTLDHATQGRLNEDRLWPIGAQHIWLDITSWATSITCRQSQQNSPAMPPDAGAAEIHLRDAPDLASIPVYAGTPIRILREGALTQFDGAPVRRIWQVVWAGTVEDIAEQWDKTTTTRTTTLTAVDGIARLSAQTRYGRGRVETWRIAVKQLTESSPFAELPLYGPFGRVPPPQGEVDCCPTVYEGPLTRHITMAAATAGIVWNISPAPADANPIDRLDPGGVIGESRQHLVLCDPLASVKAVAVFTDIPYADAGIVDQQVPRPYTGIEMTGGTRAVATVVEVTAHRVADDGTADDTTTTIADATAVSQWGHRRVTVDACPMPGAEHITANAILSRSADATIRPTSLTLHGRDATQSATEPIRILSPIDVFRLGRRYRCIVTGVTHQWRCTTNPYPAYRHTVTLTLGRRA